MVIICPNCGEQIEARVSIPRPGETKESHCNNCYTWFMITTDGKAVKKTEGPVAQGVSPAPNRPGVVSQPPQKPDAQTSQSPVPDKQSQNTLNAQKTNQSEQNKTQEPIPQVDTPTSNQGVKNQVPNQQTVPTTQKDSEKPVRNTSQTNEANPNEKTQSTKKINK